MLSSDGLTNNGGPTETIALASGSPAIDAIPVADCTDQTVPIPKPITTDQRGMPRAMQAKTSAISARTSHKRPLPGGPGRRTATA